MKNGEEDNVVEFNEKKLEEDRWYFIELYHVNNQPANALTLYIDGVLIKKSNFNSYRENVTYDENSIGCGIQIEYAGKQGEERISNNFCGEMTALYFLEVDSNLHSILFTNMKSLENLIEESNEIINKVFIQVNPKYTKRAIQSEQRVYVMKCNKKNIDVRNDVEGRYGDTRIDHNMATRDVFFNIGGIEILLPLLYNIAEQEHSIDFMYSLLVLIVILLLRVLWIY